MHLLFLKLHSYLHYMYFGLVLDPHGIHKRGTEITFYKSIHKVFKVHY